MRILCCSNRDLAGSLALNLLLPKLAHHTLRIILTQQVGVTRPDEPRQRQELRIAEQSFPNQVLFPLVERAGLTDNGQRNLTFTEIQPLRGIPVDTVSNPNGGAGLDLVRSFAPDLILSVRYGAILKSEVLAIPRLGVLNLHSGILPYYRGILANFRAMLNGAAEIGCTVHYIRDAGIDTGDIVGIHREPLQRERSLLRNILGLYPPGIEMMTTAVKTLEQGGKVPFSLQQESEAVYYKYPTVEEWDEFSRRGCRVADPSDLHELMLSYLG